MARQLFKSKSSMGPLVEAFLTCGNLVAFTEAEKEAIAAGKETPAIINGVRRQVACVLLTLITNIEFTVISLSAGPKPEVKNLTKIIFDYMRKEAVASEAVAFTDKHNSTVAREFTLDEARKQVEDAKDTAKEIGRWVDEHWLQIAPRLTLSEHQTPEATQVPGSVSTNETPEPNTVVYSTSRVTIQSLDNKTEVKCTCCSVF